jgi:Carbohydrate-selective porin, OprB family
VHQTRINWLLLGASSLVASVCITTTLVPTSSAIAGEPTLNNSETLVARVNKKVKGKKVRVKARRRLKVAPTASTPTSESQDMTQTTPPVPAPEPPPVVPEPPKAAEPTPPPAAEAPHQFSTTTKLEGEVVFGLAGTISGNFDRNPIFGYRTRLNFITKIGEGELTTRLQSIANGQPNETGTSQTPEGGLAWTDGNTTSTVGIDALKYEYRLSPQTQLVIAANIGVADDFTDTVNPYFDGGDGASGAISLFASRPSIYYPLVGAGVGIRHDLSDSTQLSLGYLAANGNNPTAGNGLFGGSYGALAQLTFKAGENSKIGLTYTRTFNVETGTGSTNASVLNGNSNNFGIQSSFQLNPQLTLGGWVNYTQNQTIGGDRQIWSWAVTTALPNIGGQGNVLGLLVGQEPKVTSSGNNTTDPGSSLHIEGFYQMKLNDNLSITPGIIYLTAPNHDPNNRAAVIGVLRTTFSFD